MLNTTLLVFWVALMASSFVISAELLPFASPLVSVWLRFLVATLCMAPLAVGALKPCLGRRVLGRYTVISALLVMFFLGLFDALRTTTPFNTAVIYTLLPLLTVLISLILLGTKPPLKKLFGFILGTSGAVWVLFVSGDKSLHSFSLNGGDWLYLGACGLLALHVVLVRCWGGGVPPVVGAFLILVIGDVLLLPVVLYSGDLWHVTWQSTAFWSALIYLALFTTLLTVLLQQHLVKAVGPNRFIAYSYLIPVFVALYQGLLTGPVLLHALPGGVFILLALKIIQQPERELAKVKPSRPMLVSARD